MKGGDKTRRRSSSRHVSIIEGINQKEKEEKTNETLGAKIEKTCSNRSFWGAKTGMVLYGCFYSKATLQISQVEGIRRHKVRGDL